MALSPLSLIFGLLAIALVVVILVFIMVPLVKFVGWLIGHVFSFIGGVLSDTVRFVGAVIALVVLVPLVPLSVVVGQWSAAKRFVSSLVREFEVAGLCLYRVALQRPLKLVLLDGLLAGVEQRLTESLRPGHEEPPSRREGDERRPDRTPRDQFDGYTIVGTLRGGGSGGKLFVAEPEDGLRRRGMPERVVIKSFELGDGSNLPQIVRESRALEAARQLGLVLDHRLDEHHFHYVMPYHPGENLGEITRGLHARTGEQGLDGAALHSGLEYVSDLLTTLARYHRNGLWHKDVKPDNIIIHDGRAHLVDLGLVTPLRSAMTLTTHGTEYFRDPELVRQAIRGMKVHQLDCTKFDVYAAGAVLFFVLENTFPGHGGLSRFERPSPEALRWIVRRAMSEYNQRYESAEAMLADLQVVLQSDDPYAVRPAELPSMGGGAPPAPAKEAPPINPAAGVAVAAAAAAAAPRPRLKVVNWWTGAYEFEHDQPAASPRGRGRSVRRTPARAAAARPGRRSASDQRAAAYERARTARARAMARRKQAVPESGTSAGVVVVSILVLGGLLAGVGVLGSALSKRSSSGTASVGHGPSAVLGAAAGDSLFILPAGDAAALAATPTVVRRAILLVNDHEHPEHPVVRAELAEVIEKHTREGLHVVHGQPADERAADLLRKYRERPDRFASSLGDELEDRGLYGLLHVTGFGDDFTAKLIESQRHGAAERRYRLGPEAAVPAPTGTERLLVIDDHPRANIGDEELLSEGLDRFERAGWELISSIEDEGALRPLLPVWGLDLGHAARHRVSAALAERGLTGIVRLETDPEARHSRMIYFLGEPVQTVLED